MRTRTVCFSIGLSMLAVAAPFALQACSSDAPATIETPDSGSNTDGAVTTRPDTSTPADGGTDTAPQGDASVEDSSTTDAPPNHVDAADIPDGGEPVTPGTVQCGATSCTVASNTCCFEADAAATCTPGANATCSSTAATLHCLEAADCTGAQVCCGSFNIATGAATTTCKTAPCDLGPGGFTGAQFCRTNGECPAGERCIVQECSAGGSAKQTLELCGKTAHAGCTAK